MLVAAQDKVVQDLTTNSRKNNFAAFYVHLLRNAPLARYWRGRTVSRVRQRLEGVHGGFDDASTTTEDVTEEEEASEPSVTEAAEPSRKRRRRIAMACPRELVLQRWVPEAGETMCGPWPWPDPWHKQAQQQKQQHEQMQEPE